MEHGDKVVVHMCVEIVKMENVIEKMENVLLDVNPVIGVTIVFNNVTHAVMYHASKIMVNVYV